MATDRPDVQPEFFGDLQLGQVLPVREVQHRPLTRGQRSHRVTHVPDLWAFSGDYGYAGTCRAATVTLSRPTLILRRSNCSPEQVAERILDIACDDSIHAAQECLRCEIIRIRWSDHDSTEPAQPRMQLDPQGVRVRQSTAGRCLLDCVHLPRRHRHDTIRVTPRPTESSTSLLLTVSAVEGHRR